MDARTNNNKGPAGAVPSAGEADAAADAEDAALRWLAEMDAMGNDAPEVEQARLHAWLCERPENRAAFESAERDWRALDVLRQLAADTPDPDVVGRWLWRRRLKRRYLPFAASAGMAVTVLAAVLLQYQPGFEAQYRTAIGQYEEVRLPDDSVMTLNTDSAATVRYDAGERRVYLEKGEGYFVVAPSSERPFSVVAGSGTVRAVGTAFDVYLHDGQVEVTVTEGIVEVLPDVPSAVDAAAVTVREGQKLEYRDTVGSVANIDPQKFARRLAWQEGMLDFRDDPLAEVIAEATRDTVTRITVDDPEIKELPVTGYLRAGDIDTLLDLITSNERIAVHRVAPDLVSLTARRD